MGHQADRLSGPLQIQHGHTGTHVLMKFSRATDHVLLTAAEAEAFIEALQRSLRLLLAHTRHELEVVEAGFIEAGSSTKH